MNSEWMKTRQTRYGAYLFTYLVVIIAVLGATNWLASRHNKSFDSTSNKKFSLSEQTAKVVKGLKSDVNITYFDKTTEFTRARDLLDRYNNFSTKLHVTYVDPDKKPQLAKAAGVRLRATPSSRRSLLSRKFVAIRRVFAIIASATSAFGIGSFGK